MHVSAPDMNRRSNHTIRFKLLHEKTHGRDISYGIHHSYLMKMYFRHRSPMSMTLRFCYHIIDGHNVFFYAFIDRKSFDNLLNVMH